MREWNGYGGTILNVNLTNGEITKEPLGEEMAKTWLGGRGFNMKVLWESIKPGIDPLGPENVLCFGFGPLTGTLFSSSCRYNISAKSPFTNHLGDSSSGGHFAAQVKYAGYDQIIFTGRADRPVYLWILDDHVELKDASHLWGKNTWETTDTIKKDLGDDGVKVSCIGQAGEHLVRTACVICDYGRAAGRTGMGAVMGSKNLKAVAVRGTKGIRIANPEEFKRLAKRDIETTMTDPDYEFFALYGTSGVYELAYGFDHPTKNFQSHLPPPGCDVHYHERFLDQYAARLKGCSACPIHCSKFYDVRLGEYAGTRGAGVELDSFKGLATQLGQADMGTALAMVTLASQYGLDSICTGDSIGFATELYERGIITRKDTDGIELKWGSVEAIEAMLHKIAMRQGLGNILAEGTPNAARIIGKGTEKYDMSSRGLSHQLDVRDGCHRLYMLTSTRGFDHLRGDVSFLITPELCQKYFGDPAIADKTTTYGKHIVTIFAEHVSALADSLTRCKFNRMTHFTMKDPLEAEEVASILSAATGLEWTGKELMKIGERIYNIEQAFGVREGISRKHYYPPWRLANEPIADGPKKGSIVTREQWDEMFDNYFKLRGWDIATAIPTRARLEELGLKYVADELEKGMPYPEWAGPPLHDSYP